MESKMTENNQKDKIRELIIEARRDGYSGPCSTVPVETGQTWDELKPRQIRNIESRLGKWFNEQTAVLFIDDTLTGSGRSGILFTTEGVIGTDFSEEGVKGVAPMIPYRDLIDIHQGRPGERVTTNDVINRYISTSYLIAEYRDGSVRVVYSSIYTQYIVSAVRKILETFYSDNKPAAEENSIGADASVGTEAFSESAPAETETLSSGETAPAMSETASVPEPNASPEDEELSNILELRDSDGNPFYFEFLDLISFKNREYVVMLPVDDNTEPTGEEVIILEVQPDENDPDQDQYLPVEDIDVLKSVYEIFRDKFKDLYDFQEPQAETTANYERGSGLPYPYNGEKPYVFISYAHKDAEKVMSIIRQLQADGYRVWYDEGIDPGTEWDDNIANHVENCGCFLAFMSGNYLASENCRDELNYARDLNLSRLLIYLDEVILTGGLAMRHNRLQALHYYKYSEMKGMFYKRLYQSSVFVGTDIKE